MLNPLGRVKSVATKKGFDMPQVETRMEILVPAVQKLFRPGVIVLLSLMCIGSFCEAQYRDFTLKNLALPPNFSYTLIWKVFTYSFVDNTLNLLLHSLIVLALGSMVEREWRTGRFLLLWALCSVGSGLFWVLAMTIFKPEKIIGPFQVTYITGHLACLYGIIYAFGYLFRRQRTAWGLGWGIEAQTIAWILIGMAAITSAIQSLWTLFMLSGLLIGWAYVTLRRMMINRNSHTPSQVSIRKGGFVDID